MQDNDDKHIRINPNAVVQEIKVGPNFGKFVAPVRMFITGPTCSGKSHFCLNLIKFRNVVFTAKYDKVTYFSP